MKVEIRLYQDFEYSVSLLVGDDLRISDLKELCQHILPLSFLTNFDFLFDSHCLNTCTLLSSLPHQESLVLSVRSRHYSLKDAQNHFEHVHLLLFYGDLSSYYLEKAPTCYPVLKTMNPYCFVLKSNKDKDFKIKGKSPFILKKKRVESSNPATYFILTFRDRSTDIKHFIHSGPHGFSLLKTKHKLSGHIEEANNQPIFSNLASLLASLSEKFSSEHFLAPQKKLPASWVPFNDTSFPEGIEWHEDIHWAKDHPESTVRQRVKKNSMLHHLGVDFEKACIDAITAISNGLVPRQNEDQTIYTTQNLVIYNADELDTTSSLQALRLLHSLETFSQKTSPFSLSCYALVTYCGQQYVVLNKIPGDSRLCYGFTEDEENHFRFLDHVVFHQFFQRSLAPSLHLQEHSITDFDGSSHQTFGSMDMKGVVSSDGRYFLLDPGRLTPPDTLHPDSAHTLRPECVASFVATFPFYFNKAQSALTKSVVGFVEFLWKNHKNDTSEISPMMASKPKGKQEENTKSMNSDCVLILDNDNVSLGASEITNSFQFVQNLHDNFIHSDRIKNAYISSFLPLHPLAELHTEYLRPTPITFNPENINNIREIEDILHSLAESQEGGGRLFNLDASTTPLTDDLEIAERDTCLLDQIALFLESELIPDAALELDSCDASHFPLESTSLSHFLHSRGINLRYLGLVAQFCVTPAAQRICLKEMVIRTARSLFHRVLKDTPFQDRIAAVVHFTNSLFPSTSHKESLLNILNEENLFSQFSSFLYDKYQFTLELPNYLALLEVEYDSLLRGFTVKVGLRLRFSTARQKFTQDDVLSFIPLVKHSFTFVPRDLIALLETAYLLLMESPLVFDYPVASAPTKQMLLTVINLLDEALDVAHQMFSSIYHPLVAYAYAALAFTFFKLNRFKEAKTYQKNAFIIYERVLGKDHYRTVRCSGQLALYYFYYEKFNQTSSLAPNFARHYHDLAAFVAGPSHPETCTAALIVALTLDDAGEIDEAFSLVRWAAEQQYIKEHPFNNAFVQHLMGYYCARVGNYLVCLEHETLSFEAFKSLLEQHPEKSELFSLCNESLSCLKHFITHILKETPSITIEQKYIDFFTQEVTDPKEKKQSTQSKKVEEKKKEDNNSTPFCPEFTDPKLFYYPSLSSYVIHISEESEKEEEIEVPLKPKKELIHFSELDTSKSPVIEKHYLDAKFLSYPPISSFDVVFSPVTPFPDETQYNISKKEKIVQTPQGDQKEIHRNPFQPKKKEIKMHIKIRSTQEHNFDLPYTILFYLYPSISSFFIPSPFCDEIQETKGEIKEIEKNLEPPEETLFVENSNSIKENENYQINNTQIGNKSKKKRNRRKRKKKSKK